MAKKFLSYLLVVSLMMIGMVNISYAKETQMFSEGEISSRLETFSKETKIINISDQTIKALEDKIKRGEILDSEKQGLKPSFVRKYSDGSDLITEEIFSDGSFIITEVTDHYELMKEYNEFLESSGKSYENWTSFISDTGVIVSSTSEHTTINGAKVRKSHGAYWAGFTFDYSTYRRRNSRIHQVYGANSLGGGGTMSLSSPRIIRSEATITTPARAEMDFTFSGYGGIGSYSGVVGITVGNKRGLGGAQTY